MEQIVQKPTSLPSSKLVLLLNKQSLFWSGWLEITKSVQNDLHIVMDSKFKIVDVCQFLQTLQSYQKRGWELVEVSLQLYLPLKLCTYELLRLISVFFYTFGLVCVYVRIKELHIWRYAGYNLHNLWIIHVHLLLNLGVKSGRPPPRLPKGFGGPSGKFGGFGGPVQIWGR